MNDTVGRPTGSNADEWLVFLLEHEPPFAAVQIAEAIEAAVLNERHRCFTWAIGSVPRSTAIRSIRDGSDPQAGTKDPSLCWRCGVKLHPGHLCEDHLKGKT